MSLINAVISTLIGVIFYLYILSLMMNKKINFKNKISIIAIIIFIISITLTYIHIDNYNRIFLNFIITSIASKYILKESFSKCLIASFFMYIYFALAEIIASLIIILLFRTNSLEISTKFFEGTWLNLAIGFIALSISSIPLLNNFFCKAISTPLKRSYNGIIIITIIIIDILVNNNAIFMGINMEYITNILLVVLFALTIWFLLREKERGNQLSLKYDQLFNYIQKYEKELNKKNMYIHEFNNQLIAIKGFINNNEAINYIDSILLDSKKYRSMVLKGMENIPKGGLKGIIYYKLGDLNEEGIKVTTQISSSLKKSNFSKIVPGIYKDIVKIIGILIDNAIEATRISEKKQIVLEIYLSDDEFNLILSNTYNGELNIAAFDDAGYSTKGKGRGYGLFLVNQVINNYDFIKEKKSINQDYYTVHLSIDMKNIPMLK